MSRKSQPGSFALTLVDRGQSNGRRRYAVRLVGHVGTRGAVLSEAPTKERAWGLAMGVLSDVRARATNFWDKSLKDSTTGIYSPINPEPKRIPESETHADQQL